MDVEKFSYSEYVDSDENFSTIYKVFDMSKVERSGRSHKYERSSAITEIKSQLIGKEDEEECLSKRDPNSKPVLDDHSLKMKKIKESGQGSADIHGFFVAEPEETDDRIRILAQGIDHSKFLEIHYTTKQRCFRNIFILK